MSGKDTIVRSRGSLKISEARELLATYEQRAAYLPNGRLARETLRLWGPGRGECPDPVPDRLPIHEIVHRDDTEVIWGGFLTLHYGHFLAESVARLWPLLPDGPLENMPVVFATPAQEPWTTDWIRAFGLQSVELPLSGAVHFSRIRIPEPAWRISGWVAPELRDIHLYARDRLEVPTVPNGKIVWLSRSKLDMQRRVNDEILCQWLLRDHIKVIHPELMSLSNQIAEIEAASGIVGPIGSAFHTLLLARSSPVTLYLSPSTVASSFTAQESLLNTENRFVHALAENHTELEQGRPYRLLVPETLRALGSTLLPNLLADPMLERLAHPERWWSIATIEKPKKTDLDIMIARVFLDPLRIDARMALGDRFEEREQFDCALEQFSIVADLVPDYAYALLRVARLLEKLGEGGRAAEVAERVLAINPSSEEARDYADAITETSAPFG